ncbi:MAG: O-antigen ligase family protein [Sedimentisphaerales bacterium]|nr:O-antigen ligase family protein [Sedimentisphaerales bacterium]
MGNTKHNMVPYMIFVVLFLNSIATFLSSNLDASSVAISISYGLLLVVPFGFVLANLHELYFRKAGFYIKLILPWIFFMWLTSLKLLAEYPIRSVVRAVCFQSGPLLMFLCFFIQGKSSTAGNFKANQRLFFILTAFAVFFFSCELIMKEKYFFGDILRIGSVLYVTMLLPWISILKNRTLRYILLAGISCLTLFSMKRSVLIQIFVGGFFYVLIQNVIIEQRKKALFILLTPFFLASLFLVFLYVNRSTSGVLFEHAKQLQEDKGSGRLYIWASLWQEYKTWPFINRVVGKGYYAIREYLAEYEAHNDFLQALWGYGAIGFLANVFFSIYLSVKAAGMILRRHPYAASFAFAVISFLIISMVSYNLYTMYWSLYILAFLGYICGIDQHEKNLRTLYPDLTTIELHQLRQEGCNFEVFENSSVQWIEMTQ